MANGFLEIFEKELNTFESAINNHTYTLEDGSDKEVKDAFVRARGIRESLVKKYQTLQKAYEQIDTANSGFSLQNSKLEEENIVLKDKIYVLEKHIKMLRR